MKHVAMVKIKDFTKTNPVRQASLYDCIGDVVKNGVPGAFVEAGVWRGGCCMLAAYAFMALKDIRDIWLYDTFRGMTEPCDYDKKVHSRDKAKTKWDSKQRGDVNLWCFAPIKDVTINMNSTKYPKEKMHYVCGDVRNTIPNALQGKIAVLRIDVDFYEATKNVLENFFEMVSDGGYIIFDDYGCWEGCKRAVDEFKEIDNHELVQVDSSCYLYKKRSK